MGVLRVVIKKVIRGCIENPRLYLRIPKSPKSSKQCSDIPVVESSVGLQFGKWLEENKSGRTETS